MGLLLGKAGRNIGEWGSGFTFRFNGVTCNVVQPLKKEWNGTKHKQMRLLLNEKRLWPTFGKNFIARELAATGLSPVLAGVT